MNEPVDSPSPLLTPEDMRDRYGVSRDYVMSKARSHTWPHVRVGRQVRFTAEHVAQIDQLQTVTPDPQQQHAASWGRRTRAS